MKQQLTTLLDTPMERGEFLRRLGFGIVMFLGGGLVFDLLRGERSHQSGTSGYGNRSYGGEPQR